MPSHPEIEQTQSAAGASVRLNQKTISTQISTRAFKEFPQLLAAVLKKIEQGPSADPNFQLVLEALSKEIDENSPSLKIYERIIKNYLEGTVDANIKYCLQWCKDNSDRIVSISQTRTSQQDDKDADDNSQYLLDIVNIAVDLCITDDEQGKLSPEMRSEIEALLEEERVQFQQQLDGLIADIQASHENAAATTADVTGIKAELVEIQSLLKQWAWVDESGKLQLAQRLQHKVSVFENTELKDLTAMDINGVRSITVQYMDNLALQNQRVNELKAQMMLADNVTATGDIDIKANVLIIQNYNGKLPKTEKGKSRATISEIKQPRDDGNKIVGAIKNNYFSIIPLSTLTHFFSVQGLPMYNEVADCRNVNFQGQKLNKANFSYAHCEQSLFIETSLKKTNFESTKLEGADFTQAKRLKSSQLAVADFTFLKANDSKIKGRIKRAVTQKKQLQEKRELENVEAFFNLLVKDIKNSEDFISIVKSCSPEKRIVLSDKFTPELKIQIDSLISECCTNTAISKGGSHG